MREGAGGERGQGTARDVGRRGTQRDGGRRTPRDGRKPPKAVANSVPHRGRVASNRICGSAPRSMATQGMASKRLAASEARIANPLRSQSGLGFPQESRG